MHWASKILRSRDDKKLGMMKLFSGDFAFLPNWPADSLPAKIVHCQIPKIANNYDFHASEAATSEANAAH